MRVSIDNFVIGWLCVEIMRENVQVFKMKIQSPPPNFGVSGNHFTMQENISMTLYWQAHPCMTQAASTGI